MAITMINGKVINSIILTFFSDMCVCDTKATEMNHLDWKKKLLIAIHFRISVCF